MLILSVPDLNILRSGNLPQAYDLAYRHHQPHHREDQQTISEDLPLGPGSRPRPPQCLRPSKRKKQFTSGRPIVSFFTSPFRPMLNCIAKLLYINSFRQPSRTTLLKAMFLTSSKNPGNWLRHHQPPTTVQPGFGWRLHQQWHLNGS